jgi:hypothetical protein
MGGGSGGVPSSEVGGRWDLGETEIFSEVDAKPTTSLSVVVVSSLSYLSPHLSSHPLLPRCLFIVPNRGTTVRRHSPCHAHAPCPCPHCASRCPSLDACAMHAHAFSLVGLAGPPGPLCLDCHHHGSWYQEVKLILELDPWERWWQLASGVLGDRWSFRPA